MDKKDCEPGTQNATGTDLGDPDMQKRVIKKVATYAAVAAFAGAALGAAVVVAMNG